MKCNQIPCIYHWRSLGLLSSEAKNASGVRGHAPPYIFFLKRWALETHFPEFKWIIYDFNNNQNNTQKTISICV